MRQNQNQTTIFPGPPDKDRIIHIDVKKMLNPYSLLVTLVIFYICVQIKVIATFKLGIGLF